MAVAAGRGWAGLGGHGMQRRGEARSVLAVEMWMVMVRQASQPIINE